MKDYEKASGAKINYDKSKGLWLGKWRDRDDDPFENLYEDTNHKIKWTNKNGEYLGVHVGNEEPAKQTFQQIIAKVRKLHFWKSLELPLLAKSRFIEIFHASKLFLLLTFTLYPLKWSKK